MDARRVSTGIAGLDPLLEGGLPAGKSFLITGKPGTGKTIFCMQYVLNGLLEGEKAVFVAVDERQSDIVGEASSLGWDLSAFLENRQLLILDASPFFSNRAATGTRAGADVSKTVGDLASYVRRMEASRVVIDPFGPLVSSNDPTVRVEEHVRTLVHALRDHMGTTNLLTIYAPPGAGSGGDEGVEEYLAAGVIALDIARSEGRISRTLTVRKMRGTAVEPAEHRFHIVKGKGIALEAPPVG